MAVFVILKWRIILAMGPWTKMGSMTSPPGSFTQQAANQYNQNMMSNASGNILGNGAQALNATQLIQHAQLIGGLGKVRKPKQFMIEGKEMDLVEFVETLYPEDCPERTYLLLKLKEK
jgi:hypothetical protein